MSYKRGINISIGLSDTTFKDYKSTTIPVYVGILPVHQLANYKDTINNPILINDFDEIYKTGYSDDWKYSLCEPIYAHFVNDFEKVSPIVLINVLDPDLFLTTEKTIQINFKNGIGKIENAGDIVRNTISISDLVVGDDFRVEYSSDGKTIKITDLSETLDGEEDVKYKEIDLSTFDEGYIVGTVTVDGKRSGIKALSYVYSRLNIIPGLLLCPSYSHIPKVHDEMVSAVNDINNHWNAFTYTDLLCDENINTEDKAIKWKEENGYNTPVEVPNFPKGYNKGKEYHLSVLRAVLAQKIDSKGNFPNNPPSNYPINIQKLILSGGKDIDLDEIAAKKLNSKGIATSIKFEGDWITWGVNTGAYNYETSESIDPRDIFESSVRVIRTLGNIFQKKFWNKIDKGLNKGIIESIINDFQRDTLDLYTSQGKILYGRIEFIPDKNQTSDMLQGDFKFNIDVTGGLVLKSITAVMRWTPKGFEMMFGGNENEN